MGLSSKVAARISSQLKKYQGVLKAAQQRDVSEADTVTIIVDMLADVFGYDKYKEVTSEHAIRGTSVDLAVIVDEKKPPDRTIRQHDPRNAFVRSIVDGLLDVLVFQLDVDRLRLY